MECPGRQRAANRMLPPKQGLRASTRTSAAGPGAEIHFEFIFGEGAPELGDRAASRLRLGRAARQEKR